MGIDSEHLFCYDSEQGGTGVLRPASWIGRSGEVGRIDMERNAKVSSPRGGRNGWGRPELLLGVMGVAFAITMALVVGSRLSSESLAVLAGTAVGIGAAIPTSWLIALVTRPRARSRPVQVRQHTPAPPPQQGAYPAVVVVAPPIAQPYPVSEGRLAPSLTVPSQRGFTVAGGDLEEAEVLDDERYR